MITSTKTLIARLNAQRSGTGWVAKCPAHNDREPSLSINIGAGAGSFFTVTPDAI
jgi:hypothetical protein